jgi:hypothetical protein
MANLSRFEWRGVPFAAWLFRIAANATADRLKKLSREQIDSPSDDLDQFHWPDIETRIALFKLVDDLPPINAPSSLNVSSRKGYRSGAVEDAWGNQWYISTPL